MLKQRAITALALLAVLLPTLFMSAPEPFIVLALFMVAAGAWEWGRLSGLTFRRALVNAVVLSGALLVLWASGQLQVTSVVWMLPSLLWIIGGVLLLRIGVPGWSAWAKGPRLVSGYVVLAFAWVAMANARSLGVNLLLSIFFLVWAADVFAYFGGKAFGRRKLAPSISPGKSWAGAYAGAIGVMVVGGLWMLADQSFAVDSPSLYTTLHNRYGWAGLIAVWALTALSVVGDLVESLVKRSAGVKDSSNLLPGHGGVLDRIDALLPVLPVAMMLVA
ncbi:MAG: phosphatidate cytidylyltransferase [Burkholderiales bacterium]|nr:phosphatidate cytidylyltransferase [Burkholderiales bacterium]